MNTTSYLFDQPPTLPTAKLEPFAYTDTFLHTMKPAGPPILHFWQLPQTVILGMKDTRLPLFKEALTFLHSINYDYLVRNSGGLAVVSDLGVLNFSLILPTTFFKSPTIPAAYDFMVQLIKASLPEIASQITVTEIAHSYCPGSYDLSVNEQKFAGIAQRRVKEGIAIMIYLSINGDQNYRGKIIQNLYKIGTNNYQLSQDYPEIVPKVMQNLITFPTVSLTIDSMKKRIISAFANLTQQTISPIRLTDFDFQTDFQKHYKKMQQRNTIIYY